jgi:hypothetical protein
MKKSHRGRSRHERRLTNRTLSKVVPLLGLLNKNKPTIVPKSLPSKDELPIGALESIQHRIHQHGAELRVAPALEGKGYQLLVLNPEKWFPVVYAKQGEAVSEGLKLFGKTAKRLLKKVA